MQRKGVGGLQPGGDLISEISLSLTKLSVKQSLVGNRVCVWGGYMESCASLWTRRQMVHQNQTSSGKGENSNRVKLTYSFKI